MAKHVNIDDKRDHTLWPMVEPKLADMTYRDELMGYPDILDPLVMWLLDPVRPGYFTFYYKAQFRDPAVPPKLIWTRVHMSDPHTAFEFRLRWS